MRKVGYIAGKSLAQIQDQWVDLLDNGANVILFDREFIKNHNFNERDTSESSQEKEKMWQYIETMSAGQDISGNFDNYQSLNDLMKGDSLLLPNLNVLFHAKPEIWDEIIELHNKGISIEILDHNFKALDSFGDETIDMMKKLYQLGKIEGLRAAITVAIDLVHKR